MSWLVRLGLSEGAQFEASIEGAPTPEDLDDIEAVMALSLKSLRRLRGTDSKVSPDSKDEGKGGN